MRKIYEILKPYRFTAIIAILLVFFQALTELYLPKVLADIVDNGIVHGEVSYILSKGALMLFVSVLAIIAAIITARLASKVAFGFGKDLRSKFFEHVTNFSLKEFDEVGTATLITRTTNDVTQVQQLVFMSMRMMARAPMMAIGGIFMALSTDVEIGLIIIATIPVIAVLMWLISSKGIPLFTVMQDKLDRLNRVSREGLSGIRVVRAFNRTEYEEQRFDQANREVTQTAVKAGRIMALMNPAMTLTFDFAVVAILWFGGLRVNSGRMSVGDMMAMIQYGTQIMFSLHMISMMFIMIPRASVSAKRVAQVFAMHSDIKDPDNPVELKDIRGELAFHDITFYYPGAEVPALKNISFTARPGQTTAIIGGIGSGKTTLMNLMLRFYDVTSGSITLDGVDIRQLSQQSLRGCIGYVPQKAMLFTGTVSENLSFGTAEATNDQIEKAAQIAQADGFISDLGAGGYESMIAQGGTNLSGGQKQRLTIARALVRKPRIYLFDDNFSALDFKTDAKVRMGLREETSQDTVIIVAQRVSTVMGAEQIIVLDAGQIAGIGTHQELLATCPVYQEIVTSQLAEEAIA
jgi:ATP-binding cassette subfamily B multidrug efflux pump